MKRTIAKVYYDKAKALYPDENDKTRLMDIAEQIKLSMNAYYGCYSLDK